MEINMGIIYNRLESKLYKFNFMNFMIIYKKPKHNKLLELMPNGAWNAIYEYTKINSLNKDSLLDFENLLNNLDFIKHNNRKVGIVTRKILIDIYNELVNNQEEYYLKLKAKKP